MRALLQRVNRASVEVGGHTAGSIHRGLLVFVAVGRQDGPEDAQYIADKVLNLRIFPDDQDRFDRSIVDIGGELLVVSQFTLYAGTRKGRRPSFTEAAPPEEAAIKFSDLVARFSASGLRVETGRFQEMMEVSLVNDGPVTIWIDSAERHQPRG